MAIREQAVQVATAKRRKRGAPSLLTLKLLEACREGACQTVQLRSGQQVFRLLYALPRSPESDRSKRGHIHASQLGGSFGRGTSDPTTL